MTAPHMPTTRTDWSVLLRKLGRAGLEAAGRLDEARPDWTGQWTGDDLGHRRPVDAPFFEWRRRRRAIDLDRAAAAASTVLRSNEPRAAPPVATDAAALHAEDPDVVLWRALAEPEGRARALELLDAARDAASPRDRTDAGALFGQQQGHVPLEVWTERELACVHALGWLVPLAASDPSSASIAAALDDHLGAAMTWHLDNLQPDNATNHPWALHIFLDRALREDDGSALLYSQALLHNCQIAQGRPDAFSAHLLLDAAEWLDVADRAPDQRPPA